MTNREYREIRDEADRAVFLSELPAELREDEFERRATAMSREFRILENSLPNLSAENGAGSRKIVGRAAPIGKLSKSITGRGGTKFRERIAPTFFDRTLRGSADVAALYNHNPDAVLGRTSNGTLQLSKDSAGLNYSIDAPQTTWGRDATESVRRGDVDGVSFGFRNVKDDWNTEQGERVRTLLDGDVFEISLTAFPAYDGTTASLRSRLIDSRSDDDDSVGVYSNMPDLETDTQSAYRRKLQLMMMEAGMAPSLADVDGDYRSDLLRYQHKLYALQIGIDPDRVTGDPDRDMRYLELGLMMRRATMDAGSAMDAGNAAGRCVWP